jgi:hypothetical protein
MARSRSSSNSGSPRERLLDLGAKLLRLLPVLLPRHRYTPPPPIEEAKARPIIAEAPAAWPVELGLIAVETFIDTARQLGPSGNAGAMLPSTRATMRARNHAQRERARELGLHAANAPRPSVQHTSLIPLLLPPAVQAIQRRRHGPSYSFSTGWRLVLLGKLIGELDRRRSWRLASSSNQSHMSNQAILPSREAGAGSLPEDRTVS